MQDPTQLKRTYLDSSGCLTSSRRPISFPRLRMFFSPSSSKNEATHAPFNSTTPYAFHHFLARPTLPLALEQRGVITSLQAIQVVPTTAQYSKSSQNGSTNHLLVFSICPINVHFVTMACTLTASVLNGLLGLQPLKHLDCELTEKRFLFFISPTSKLDPDWAAQNDASFKSAH